MPTATITSKGQVTIPAEVRRKLRLHEGMKIDFVEEEDGHFAIRPRARKLMDLYGIAYNGVHATLEEIEEGIIQGAIESAGLDR
ncbi:MAG: AbrB/MazE/SpoVT family DNA-binding domain-containing protein [Bifidobacteriaceae bacterium]|jgi:AbrB family looped-hinge helix DNA binding protein|nr:AbrB/MazE/SpoVT family DNA-binding domain-containing protein [Bifidobacteriaceae bacterium]